MEIEEIWFSSKYFDLRRKGCDFSFRLIMDECRCVWVCMYVSIDICTNVHLYMHTRIGFSFHLFSLQILPYILCFLSEEMVLLTIFEIANWVVCNVDLGSLVLIPCVNSRLLNTFLHCVLGNFWQLVLHIFHLHECKHPGHQTGQIWAQSIGRGK